MAAGQHLLRQVGGEQGGPWQAQQISGHRLHAQHVHLKWVSGCQGCGQSQEGCDYSAHRAPTEVMEEKVVRGAPDTLSNANRGPPREGRVWNWQGLARRRQDARVSFWLQILVTSGLPGFRLSGPHRVRSLLHASLSPRPVELRRGSLRGGRIPSPSLPTRHSPLEGSLWWLSYSHFRRAGNGKLKKEAQTVEGCRTLF